MDKRTIIDYIMKKYGTSPEYLWKRYPDYAVFRHEDNSKWFALMAGVPGSKLGLAEDNPVEVINLKIDDLFFRDMLIKEEGIMPAYHMNKQHWITVLLDGTVSDQRIHDLIDMSFLATASAKKKEKIRPQKRYKPDKFTFERLKTDYGIYAVRGPRGMPNSLSEALKT